MKLIRLCLIALLLQPCPVCWGHELAAVGDCEKIECEKQVSPHSCCSHCTPLQLTQKNDATQRHDKNHDCPCFCHVSEIVFAQTIPVVNLRSITPSPSVVVDLCCLAAQTAVSKNSDAAVSSVPITVPLRI